MVRLIAAGGGLDPAQLGVAAFTVSILTAAVIALWRDNIALRGQARDDSKLILPALADASAASRETAKVLADFSRLADRLLDRLGRDRP